MQGQYAGEVCTVDGGLINPANFPCKSATLDTAVITGSGDKVAAIGTKVLTATQEAETAWKGLQTPGVFETPDGDVVCALIQPAVTGATDMEGVTGRLSNALHTYASELESIKPDLESVEQRATAFGAEAQKGYEVSNWDLRGFFGNFKTGVDGNPVPKADADETSTISWQEHGPAVETNAQLLHEWDQQAHLAGESGWHRWEEDGVAALTESVANVGTFFIPVAGVAAGGTKTVLAGTRAGSIVATTAGHLAEFVVPAGSYLVKGTVRVVDLGSDLAKGGWRGMIVSLTPGPIRPNALPGVAGVATDAPMALPPRTPVSNSLGLDGVPPAHTGGHGPVSSGGGTPHGDFDGPTSPERPAGESQLGEANGTEHQGSDSNAGNNNGSSAGRDALTDSTGRDLRDVLAQSDLSKPEPKTFLQRNYPADYDQYQLTGQWPADVQLPRGASALTSDGRIDWDQVPEGGYVLENGKAVKETYVPSVGEVIDRYGPPNGRYTSPVPESGPYAYGQRSLSYVEDPGQYH